ncbi:hypothetical protein JMM81_12600 [Bacillus sp. V3B]|uniref:hypothetical protein n=1 Tax=Bacillus sp. V3B TaxID=2804915 RepID=UPI00210BB318|nr:hypothetical protein [Bacillus sp. V3B]MCQ6275795.1 hypothetical protein [Bacillus sp. V3B]
MDITTTLAYLGAVTGIIGTLTGCYSLYILRQRYKREKPKLKITKNEEKRNGYLFRYPETNEYTDWGDLIIDKENPVDVAFMSLKLINESSFTISIHSVEIKNSKEKGLIHSRFPTIQIDDKYSMNFSHESYIKLPLNIKAFEIEEHYICFDFTPLNTSSNEQALIILHTSRGVFKQKIHFQKYIDG